MAGIKSLITWWQSLPLPWRDWRVVGRVGAGDEVPGKLPNRGVVIVGTPGRESWAAFDCPCRRGHRLMVNLDKSRRPAWNIDSVKPLTIRPSIDNVYSQGRCHFTLRGGKINWAHNVGRSAE